VVKRGIYIHPGAPGRIKVTQRSVEQRAVLA
jgi:hypothetical protein